MTEQLFLYEDDNAATTAMAGLVEAVRACGFPEGAIGDRVDSSTGLPTGLFPTGGVEQIAGLRAGNAVFLLGVTNHDQLISTLGIDELYEMASRLCTALQLCDPAPAMFPLPGESATPPSTQPSR